MSSLLYILAKHKENLMFKLSSCIFLEIIRYFFSLYSLFPSLKASTLILQSIYQICISHAKYSLIEMIAVVHIAMEGIKHYHEGSPFRIQFF